MMRTLTAALGSAALGLVVTAGETAHPLSATATEATDLRFNTVRVETGVKLHYAEQGPADGEAVILLHGYSDSWWSFSRLLPLLPKNVHAFALDLRGHGDSDRPASGYSMQDMARDVVAFMNAKRIDRATIIGHSMGSFVAQQVVVEVPARVARLVLIGSATTPQRINGMNELKAEAAALTDPVSVDFIRGFQESTVHVPVPAEFMARVIGESRKLSANVWRRVAEGMISLDAPKGLADLRIPTLILWGELDAYAPRTEQPALIDQHGTAWLRIYRETSHSPHWERPQDVADDVNAFLRIEPAVAR